MEKVWELLALKSPVCLTSSAIYRPHALLQARIEILIYSVFNQQMTFLPDNHA